MRAPLGVKDKVQMFSNLSTMIAAGIPLLESVDSLRDDSKGSAKKILQHMHQQLSEGKTISSALSAFPGTFDPIVINLLKTAEEAGTLEQTLLDIVDGLRAQAALRDKIKSSMTYPIFVGIIFIGVLILMLTFVIPRVGKVFQGMGVPLPLPTKVLIYSSDQFLRNWPKITLGAALGVGAFIMLIKLNRKLIINAFLALPGLKTVGRNIDIAYFTRSMHLMLTSGVPIDQALALAEEVVVKKEMRLAVQNMREAVAEGKPISDSLRKTKILTPMAIRIIQTGEQAGTLDKAMKDLGEFFAKKVNDMLTALSTLLEPLMLAFIGVVVGGMMMSIIAPIYSVMSQLGQQ